MEMTRAKMEQEKWSARAWSAAQHIYEAILELPFVRELADGTLPRDKFEFYIRQDSLYINRYCRVLASIASRMPAMELCEAFLDFAKDGVAVERMMHSGYLDGSLFGSNAAGASGVTAHPDSAQMSPACLLYTSVLEACGAAPVEVAAAAVLPCFWIYQAVGEHIASQSSPSNPYSAWIATYSDPAFRQSTLRAIAICDSLAAQAGAELREAMLRKFVLCARMEWMFWESAYNKEQWKI